MWQVSRGCSKGSLSTILTSISSCLSVQVSRKIYDFGKQVEVPSQYYISLSGSISLCDASYWPLHYFDYLRHACPEVEVQWMKRSKFSDTYLHIQCSVKSISSFCPITLVTLHRDVDLHGWCLASYQWRIWPSTMPYHRCYYHGLQSKLRRAHFPIIQNSDVGCLLCFVLLALDKTSLSVLKH